MTRKAAKKKVTSKKTATVRKSRATPAKTGSRAAGSSKSRSRKAASKSKSRAVAETPASRKRAAASSPDIATPVKLLSGGNPQIAKAEGDAPVHAYIDAMPGWKRDIGRRLDRIITATVPGVRKAVKWNSPLYGFEGRGDGARGEWFLSFHCFAKYVKVAFFRGASLRPLPPGESKQKEVRYLDIRETDELDERLFAEWVRQASKLPGERM